MIAGRVKNTDISHTLIIKPFVVIMSVQYNLYKQGNHLSKIISLTQNEHRIRLELRKMANLSLRNSALPLNQRVNLDMHWVNSMLHHFEQLLGDFPEL
jgi:hypothetical protein